MKRWNEGVKWTAEATDARGPGGDAALTRPTFQDPTMA